MRTQKGRAQHYAARFAAKEALFKATGEGWASALAGHEISVLHTADGQPFFTFTGETKRYFEEKNWQKIHLSLSHVAETALALVVIETSGD